MIVQIDRVVPGQHRQNRRHGEHVGDVVTLHQTPRFRDIETFARHQHGGGAARDLRQGMHAGAVRQRRDHQRNVLFGGARHQIAQMVANDVIHLAMRQHARFWPPGGAGGVEEPRRMVAIDIGRTGDDVGTGGERFPPVRNGNLQPARGVFGFRARRRVRGRRSSKICTDAPEDVARYATSGGVRRKLVGTQTAPNIQAANMDSSTALELRAWRRIRSPCRTPCFARAPAAAWTRALKSDQVQVVSRQMTAGRSGNRRAVWISK